MKKTSASLWLSAALAVLSAPLYALSSDSEQPINIEADRAEADDLNQVTIYRGDVIITQGTLRIQGDVVTIHFDDAQEMTKLIAQGKPARFRQKPDGDERFQNAEARTMEFYAKTDTIVLLGNAHSWQGDDSIKAERIVYDTRKGKVNAESVRTTASAEGEDGGDPQTSTRVKITIAPKKKAAEPE